MRRRIDVHIDELRIAEGHGNPEAIAEAIETQLRRLLDENGLPTTAGGHLDSVEASYRNDSPGAAAARAVYEGMVSSATDSN